MKVTKRDVLKGLGAGFGLSVGVGLVRGAESALDDATPEYVTRSYDSTLLSDWQPRLKTNHLDIKPHTAYAYVARSTEQETAALSYWHTYRGQNGWVGADSHFGDHEPVVLFVDESTDELVEARYSAYHWFAGVWDDAPTDDEGRPTFRAHKPYHHHIITDDDGGSVDLGELSDGRLEDWLANGWEVHVPALARPWVMLNRSDWWADDVGPVSVERTLRRAYLAAGIGGADDADTENLTV